MLIITPLIGGIVLVFTLIHRMLHNHVVARLHPGTGDSKSTTTLLMLVLCVLFPILPALMLTMGVSVGVVSLLTLGLIKPSGTKVAVVRKVDAREVPHVES